MADHGVQQAHSKTHVPLNSMFFERLTHHDADSARAATESPWYLRFASAWASWCGKHEEEAEEQ